MRTTLTLDDDLAEKLRKLAHERRVPFRRVVNEVIRQALAKGAPSPSSPEAFTLDTFRSAFHTGVDPLRINQLVDELDATHAIEKTRR